MPKGKTMSTRRLIDNDYSFGNGQADIITGLEECLQKCKTTLMQLRGEWFLDGRDGVPWGDVLGQSTDEQALTDTVKRTLLAVDGVTSVTSLIINTTDRAAFVIAKLGTVFGQADFTQSLNVLEQMADDAIN